MLCRYIYTYEQLANGSTHDKLWNAAQRQMVVEGKVGLHANVAHGFALTQCRWGCVKH